MTADSSGAALGGTLTVAARHGVATFSGLSINRAGSYRILASTDPATTALTTPVTLAAPPTIVAEKVLFAGKGRRRHVVGLELDFSRAMDPTRTMSPANYTFTQSRRRGRQLSTQPVAFRAAYDAAAHAVTLTLAGKATFARGGRPVVVAHPPDGVADSAGVSLDGGDLGTPGDDATFVIAPKGKGISRRAEFELGR